MLVCKNYVVGLVGKVQKRSKDVCTDCKGQVTKVGGAKRNTEEDDNVKPEEGVAT